LELGQEVLGGGVGRPGRALAVEEDAELVLGAHFAGQDAADVDVTPVQITFLFLWDLTGALVDDIDSRIDVPRFVGASW